MVGFLVSVGKGNERPEAVRELLEAKAPRTARVETAPSRGLSLWKVFYGSVPGVVAKAPCMVKCRERGGKTT